MQWNNPEEYGYNQPVPSHNKAHTGTNISYPLFADADMGIYPHAALQYHTRLKAKRGIVMLSVDKFLYPWDNTLYYILNDLVVDHEYYKDKQNLLNGLRILHNIS